jgi:hypothetical protein
MLEIKVSHELCAGPRHTVGGVHNTLVLKPCATDLAASIPTATDSPLTGHATEHFTITCHTRVLEPRLHDLIAVTVAGLTTGLRFGSIYSPSTIHIYGAVSGGMLGVCLLDTL